jgi:glycosyltransferase involved in cell wall biosynthesis
LGIDPADAVVLTVACLKPQKDPLSWVRVAQRVVQQRPQTSFILAGDGVMRPAVTAAIAAANLSQKCRLLGWRSDIAQLLRLCDVVLHTSLWEGLPQVFAQAMACARPVVATCVDGAPEAIEAGVTGLLRQAGDVAGLAEDVAFLLANPGYAQAMGQASQSRAERFSQERMLLDLQQFYADLTQDGAP